MKKIDTNSLPTKSVKKSKDLVFHKDGTVTLFNCYLGQYMTVTPNSLTGHLLMTLHPTQRELIRNHKASL